MVFYCKYDDCNTYATYNYKHINERLYCRIHKLENMVNKKNKICIYTDCLSRGLFGFNKKKVYCNKHKHEYMDDLFHKICKKCFKQPSFNFPNNKSPIYCSLHKEEGMVNVKKKMCKICNKGLYKYNKDYCKSHYIQYMISTNNESNNESNIL